MVTGVNSVCASRLGGTRASDTISRAQHLRVATWRRRDGQLHMQLRKAGFLQGQGRGPRKPAARQIEQRECP